MDDETILELITDFLRTRNLLRSSEILDEEREVFLHHNDSSRVSSSNGQSLGMKPSILEQLLLEGRKSMFVNHNGVHVSSELERAKDSKEEAIKQQQQDWNILKKSSANTLTEEHVVYYDDDDEVEDEQILGNGALKRENKTPTDNSRSASRTSSLHKRSTSMNSYLSSKSASFLGLGESDDDAATSTPPVQNFEFESDVDEWSDDDDAGFVKLSMEEFYQYGDDDFSVSHRAFRAFNPVEQNPKDLKDLPTPTKKDLASSDFSLPPIQLEYENPDDEYPDIPANQFIDTSDDYDDNSWDQPVTQDLPQDNISEPGFEVQSPAAVPSPSMFHHTEEKNNDTSFTHEDFEVDRLSELLRGHIQISRDEYYNDPAKFWKSEDPKPPEFQDPTSSQEIPPPKEDDEEETEPKEEEEEETKTEITYDSFNLPIIYQRGRTGLEESKDFPIVPNTVIAGRYQILEFLGAAAFSTAVKCLDLSTGQQVCVKIIKNNKEFVDQSLDEIKLLMQINHNIDPDEKFVLQLYDYFYHREHLFIVTELLRENLYDFYRYNRESGEEFYFTIERMKRITKQLLIGLEYIHSLNLIHADLKPENILIKSYSRVLVKIIDFGSSCYTKDHLSSYVQSRSYRAPEVMLGLPYDQRIDIWSLGCILAELWTGKVLFQNESIATLLARVVGILGPFDEELLRNSRHASKYFTSNGLLYDKKEDQYIFLIPKKTSLTKRLKCDDAMFVEFVASLLTLRPEKRPTAAEALQHPFLADVQI